MAWTGSKAFPSRRVFSRKCGEAIRVDFTTYPCPTPTIFRKRVLREGWLPPSWSWPVYPRGSGRQLGDHGRQVQVGLQPQRAHGLWLWGGRWQDLNWAGWPQPQAPSLASKSPRGLVSPLSPQSSGHPGSLWPPPHHPEPSRPRG